MEINYNHCELPNGLRIIHKQTSNKVAYCGFFINTGTRDELPEEHGMAHFVEHMLFKGTKKRKAHHIINRMESVGADLNAYTNKEETVIYSTFLAEHYKRAIELLTDLVFQSTFPENELEREKDVVIDEIHSYEDSPSELIYDEFEDLIFSHQTMGHNILGNEHSIESFNSKKVIDFVNRNYNFNNIVFFSYGNIKFEDIKKQLFKLTQHLSTNNTPKNRISSNELNSVKLKIEKDTSQTHAIIGTYAYEINNDKLRALSLLNNILGGPSMNSRLNIALREKKGLVYNIESNINAYSDTGVFSIYFGGDKKNLEKCINLVNKELKLIREQKLSTYQLAQAKKQYIGQAAIASENAENMALALAKSYFYQNHINSFNEFIEKIEQISSSDLLDVANEVLKENKLFHLIYY